MTIGKMWKPYVAKKEPAAANKPRLPEASTCDKHLYLPGYRTLDEVYCSLSQNVNELTILTFR
jgi:hypothetical protein